MQASPLLHPAPGKGSYLPVFLSLAALFLGPNVLLFLGYPQLDPSSAPIFRIHPLTYLLFILFFMQFLASDFRPGVLSQNPRVKQFLFVAVTVFIYSLFGSSKSNGYFLDTFIDALLLVYLFGFYSDRTRKYCFLALNLFFFLNCGLAIWEKAMGASVFPRGPEPGYERIFRSTAFQGYCLNNAFIIGTMTVYFIAYYRSLLLKCLFFGLGMLAVMSFGARGGLVGISLGFIGILFYELRYYPGVRKLNQFSVYALLLVLLGLGATYLITSTSYGERFMHVSYDDESADVRYAVYNMFDHINTQQLFFGMPQDEIDDTMHREGIRIIENFWIVWIFKYGLILTVLLGFTLVRFVLEIMKPFRGAVRYIIIAVFFLIASGNNSLSTSTMGLNILVLCGLTALPGPRASLNVIDETEEAEPNPETHEERS